MTSCNGQEVSAGVRQEDLAGDRGMAVPLTTSEQELLRVIAAQGGRTYEIRRLYRFPKRSVSFRCIRRAVELLAREQPTLRTTFPRVEPFRDKHVHEHSMVAVHSRIHHASVASLAEEEGEIERYCPLEFGAPAACALVECADGDAMVLRLAHEAFDEISLAVFLAGMDRYSRPGSRAAPLSTTQFKAATLAHNDACGTLAASSASYWRQWSRRRPNRRPAAVARVEASRRLDGPSGTGDRAHRRLSAAEQAAAAAHRRCERVTPAAQFLAAFSHAIARLLGGEGHPLMLAVPVAARTDAASWRLIGYFAKLTPVVLGDTDATPHSRQEAQRSLRAALVHVHTPPAETVKHVLRCREAVVAARWPPPLIFSTSYREPVEPRLGCVQGTEVPLRRTTARANLTCAVRIGSLGTELVLEFDTSSFDREEVARMLDQIIAAACTDG